ncbi:hypothetical protein ACVGWD_00055, partial [Enterobacter asburiae]
AKEVQPNHLLRTRGFTRVIGNRPSSRICWTKCIRWANLLKLFHHNLLKRQIIKNRFKKQIAGSKNPVIRRTGDKSPGFFALAFLCLL